MTTEQLGLPGLGLTRSPPLALPVTPMEMTGTCLFPHFQRTTWLSRKPLRRSPRIACRRILGPACLALCQRLSITSPRLATATGHITMMASPSQRRQR
jgi:hypothetical protein